MKIILGLLARALLCALALPLAALAQEWAPTKPVRIIVPVQGTTNDFLARLVAPKLAEAIGQPVTVENRPGAGGNIGANLVAKSDPDGHTLLVGYNGPMAINPTLFANIPYDPIKDFAPITLAMKGGQYLVAHPGSGINSVQDLVQIARKNPAKLSYASIAVGSGSHLTMEMLKFAAGIHMVHIPYRGGADAVGALLAGDVQAAFFVPGNVQQFAKEGRLKLVATTGAKRFASTPEVPTMIEAGFKDFEATVWVGFLAAGGTPKRIIDRYHREIVKILHSPDVSSKLKAIEYDIVAGTPEEFGNWLRLEIERWSKIVKATGAKAE